MPVKKYEVNDGEKITFPATNGILKHVCCDCGLTHDIEVIIHGRTFDLIFHRNNRSTGQFRRHLRQKLDEGATHE